MHKSFQTPYARPLSSFFYRLKAVFSVVAISFVVGLSTTSPLPANAESNADNTLDGLKTLSEYDSELNQKTDEEIMTNDELKLKLLQRTFLKRIDPENNGQKGHEKLTNFAKASEDNHNAAEYLFLSLDNLEDYLLGGTAEGNASNYLTKSLPIFSKLYARYQQDIKDETYGQVYRKMMMAISLAYGDDVTGWQTYQLGDNPWARVKSDPLGRYDVIKKLLTENITFDGVSTAFDKEVFTNLEIEEMRWVVNNRISDEEIDWLNWFTQKVKSGGTAYGSWNEATQTGDPNPNGFMNPYTYIYYDGGSHWYYEDPEYYKDESDYCALSKLGNINKFHTKDKYLRGENCNNKYGLNNFPKLKSTSEEPKQLRVWTIMEEDGVCGSLAGVGTNIQMAYGIPSSLVSQPGHAAYFVSSEKNFKDEKLRFWDIGNSVSSWPNSYKGERMMLNWGTRNIEWSDNFNAPYLLSAQRAVDHFDEYTKSFYYNQIADLRSTFDKKVTSYKNAIQNLKFNIDSWYGLIQETLKEENHITSQQYYEMAEKLIEDMKEFPMPMADLIKLFQDKIDIGYQIPFQSLYNSTLTELSTTPTDESSAIYFQPQAIRQVANYLLGKVGDTEVAEFSFDGENANKLMLKGIAKDANAVFEYSINSDADNPNTGTWKQIADGSNEVNLSDVASQINDKNDILVHVQGTERTAKTVFRIDIQDSKTSDELSRNVYANELERKVSGIDESITEWIEVKDDSHDCDSYFDYDDEFDYDGYLQCYMQTDDYKLANNPDALDWKSFSDSKPVIPDDGNKVDGNKSNLYIRTSRHGVYLAGKTARMVAFDPKEKNEQRDYIPNSELSVESTVYDTKTVEKEDGSVEIVQEPVKDENLTKLLDGNITTYWQNNPLDEDKELTYTLANPANLTSLEYILYSPSSVGWGKIESISLETSLDGEKWTTVENELEWQKKQIDEAEFSYMLHYFNFEEPIYAKYIRIVPLRMETITNAIGQQVANSNARITMFNFYRDTTAKIDISLLELLLSMNGDTFTYNGEEHQPTVTIGDYDGSTLQSGHDYSIAYENNRNAGTAKIKINGSGEKYKGEITKEFTINKAANPPQIPNDSYEAPENATKLSDIVLPDGWNWEESDKSLTPGENITANALYKDTANYENTTKPVNVTVPAKTNPPVVDPEPSGPTDPENPTDPNSPTNPDTPTDPNTPSKPTTPAPSTPTNPTSPSTPTNPSGSQSSSNNNPSSGNNTPSPLVATNTPSTSNRTGAAPDPLTAYNRQVATTDNAENQSANQSSDEPTQSAANNASEKSNETDTETEIKTTTEDFSEETEPQPVSALPYVIGGVIILLVLAILYFYARNRQPL